MASSNEGAGENQFSTTNGITTNTTQPMKDMIAQKTYKPIEKDNKIITGSQYQRRSMAHGIVNR